jgi:hypothetical protein
MVRGGQFRCGSTPVVGAGGAAWPIAVYFFPAPKHREKGYAKIPLHFGNFIFECCWDWQVVLINLSGSFISRVIKCCLLINTFPLLDKSINEQLIIIINITYTEAFKLTLNHLPHFVSLSPLPFIWQKRAPSLCRGARIWLSNHRMLGFQWKLHFNTENDGLLE